MTEDDEEKTDETSDSIRARSMESKIDTVHLQNFHSRKQSRTHGCLGPLTIAEPTASLLDRPISFNVFSSRDPIEQTIRGGDRGAAATVNPLSTAGKSFKKHPDARILRAKEFWSDQLDDCYDALQALGEDTLAVKLEITRSFDGENHTLLHSRSDLAYAY